MSRHNGLCALLSELAAMPAASRRSIMAALTPEEREALATRPAIEPDASTGRDVSPFSPWLTSRVDAVRDSGTSGPAMASITAASRQALLRALKADAPAQNDPAKPAPGKSLFDSFGGRLATRMGRP